MFYSVKSPPADSTFPGNPRSRRHRWRQLPSWKKGVLLLLDSALVLGGLVQYGVDNPLLTVPALATVYLYNRGGLAGRGIFSAIFYWLLLLNAFDETIFILPFVLREAPFWGTAATLAGPLFLAGLAIRYFSFIKPYRIALTTSLVATALLSMYLGSSHDADTTKPALTNRAIRVLAQWPGDRTQGPRKILVDSKRNILYLSNRFGLGTPSIRIATPVTLYRYDLAAGTTTPYSMTGGEAIGMALDDASGDLVVSLARTKANQAHGKFPVRELAVIDETGGVVHRVNLPSDQGGYYDYLAIVDGRVFLLSDNLFLETDLALKNIRFDPRHDLGLPFCSRLTGADSDQGNVFFAAVNPPIKGRLGGNNIQSLSLPAMKQQAAIKDNWTGYWNIALDPDHRMIAALNNSLFERAQVSLYSLDLLPLKQIPLPGVVRAFAVDFRRGRIFTADFATGKIAVFTLDTGKQLTAIDLGVVVGAMAVGPSGEVYLGAKVGLYRLDPDLLLSSADGKRQSDKTAGEEAD